MADPVLFLSSDDLLNKWGFDDGSEPGEFLDYLDALGLPYPGRGVWTDVLRRLVREYLVPALGQEVELVDIETSHNPIRAATVDGVDMSDYWAREPEEFPVRLAPVTVEVPMSRVLEVVREVDSQAADFGQTGDCDDPRPGGPDRNRLRPGPGV